jgi:aminomethyltransferase
LGKSKTPYQASCGWVVKLAKEENFIGKDIMALQKQQGVAEKWTGFVLTGAGIAREGCLIYKDGQQVGKLTSATYSPLFKCICAGYAPASLKEGDTVEIEVRGNKIPAKVVKMPFYKNRV